MAALFRTHGTASLLILRLVLAAVIWPHGAQKVLGWFGGPGLTATLQTFKQQLGIPPVLTALALAAEFLGPLGLAVGLLTRIAAFGIGCTMLVALITVHRRNGFFMNWNRDQPGEGFEYHLMAIGMAVTLIIAGPGRLSLDALIARALR